MNQIKEYLFEVMLPKEIGVAGAILTDQVKKLDFRVRKAEDIPSLPKEVIPEVLAKLGTLF